MQRQNGLVVAIDIDGTLGDYHGHFTRFAEQWSGRAMPAPHWDGAVPFHRYLSMSKGTYRQCKLAYRQGGMKRSMPVHPYARELTVELRQQGLQVWICTTRPYLRLDNIDPDTRHWLRRHRIQYDGVLFGERKYRDLVRIVGKDNVVTVIDDLPEMVRHANDNKLWALLLDRPYNRPPVFHGSDWNGLRVHDLQEACAEISLMAKEARQ